MMPTATPACGHFAECALPVKKQSKSFMYRIAVSAGAHRFHAFFPARKETPYAVCLPVPPARSDQLVVIHERFWLTPTRSDQLELSYTDDVA